MTLQELKQIAKTVTIEDIVGAVSIFATLFVCLAWVWVAT
jgi:hypothetical protein